MKYLVFCMALVVSSGAAASSRLATGVMQAKVHDHLSQQQQQQYLEFLEARIDSLADTKLDKPRILANHSEQMRKVSHKFIVLRRNGLEIGYAILIPHMPTTPEGTLVHEIQISPRESYADACTAVRQLMLGREKRFGPAIFFFRISNRRARILKRQTLPLPRDLFKKLYRTLSNQPSEHDDWRAYMLTATS